jgi:putative glutamine transport system permease protein
MAQVFADIFTADNTRYLFAGLLNTLLIAVMTVLISIVLGTVLALFRNYHRGVPGKIAAVYIEIFRNTPLLLWILICIILVHFGRSMTRGTLALILYTSAVIAEIVRGGLNSIHFGQFEAARSQGFSFIQTLCYIVLPQCFKRVVPSLLSQVITTVKDTSFLSQYAIAEFFHNSKNLLSSLPQKITLSSAHIFVIFGFIALIYFIINFSLSCLVRMLASSDQKLHLHDVGGD